MLAMLSASTRYREDGALVEAYQRANGLDADGKYGPGTAKSIWEKYDLVPVNPYYFSSNQTRAHQQAAEYKSWLDGIAEQLEDAGRLTEAALADRRSLTVGR